jgi:ABC-type nickel/cobalt efflux system permease component RcnA
VPVVDTSQVIVRRMLAGKNPLSTPGKDHLHHGLLSWGLSQGHSAIVLWTVTLVANLAAMHMQGTRPMAIGTVAIGIVALLTFTVKWRNAAAEAVQQKNRQMQIAQEENDSKNNHDANKLDIGKIAKSPIGETGDFTNADDPKS